MVAAIPAAKKTVLLEYPNSDNGESVMTVTFAGGTLNRAPCEPILVCSLDVVVVAGDRSKTVDITATTSNSTRPAADMIMTNLRWRHSGPASSVVDASRERMETGIMGHCLRSGVMPMWSIWLTFLSNQLLAFRLLWEKCRLCILDMSLRFFTV